MHVYVSGLCDDTIINHVEHINIANRLYLGILQKAVCTCHFSGQQQGMLHVEHNVTC